MIIPELPIEIDGSLSRQSQIELGSEIGLVMQLIKYQRTLVQIRSDRKTLPVLEYSILRRMYLAAILSIRYRVRGEELL